MLGAIAGDIIGSVYESAPVKDYKAFILGPGSDFTDDTVLTAATADAVLHGRDYGCAYREWAGKYPERGYGSMFLRWAGSGSSGPSGSWGNGAAMRVSPLARAFKTLDEVLEEAARSAAATHNHPEASEGARSAAAAGFLALRGKPKDYIRDFISNNFTYEIDIPYKELKKSYTYDLSCRGTVPGALISFLESEDYEDAVRKALSLGGDADTLCCITGGIAEYFYGGIPDYIKEKTLKILPEEITELIKEFYRKCR